jgi:hypothetical protein
MPKEMLKSMLLCVIDCSFYEKPLAVGANQKKTADDDTPKSFLRLIKRKSRKELIAEGTVKPAKEKNPKIQPGESLGEFRRYVISFHWCRRVDREIPLRLGGMNRETRPKKQKPKPKPIYEDEDDDIPKKKKKKLFAIVNANVDVVGRGVYRQIHMHILRGMSRSITP